MSKYYPNEILCRDQRRTSRGRPYWQHGYRARVANHNYTTATEVSDDNQLHNYNDSLIQLLLSNRVPALVVLWNVLDQGSVVIT